MHGKGIIYMCEISTETAFVVVSEPKIEECPGTKQQQYSVQTSSPQDRPPRGAKPKAVTSSAIAVTHLG